MAKASPNNTDTPKRKGFRWDWVFLGLILFMVLSFMLQKCGIKVMQQTDDSEIIDKPHRD